MQSKPTLYELITQTDKYYLLIYKDPKSDRAVILECDEDGKRKGTNSRTVQYSSLRPKK